MGKASRGRAPSLFVFSAELILIGACLAWPSARSLAALGRSGWV